MLPLSQRFSKTMGTTHLLAANGTWDTDQTIMLLSVGLTKLSPSCPEPQTITGMNPRLKIRIMVHFSLELARNL